MRDGVVIRNALLADAIVISMLSKQLGYDVSVSDMESHLRLLDGRSTDITFVVEDSGEVIGWMQVSEMVRLESGRFCEIVGLVVDERYRGKGIGKLLVRKAMEWCADIRCIKLKVRTNILRVEVHKFYASAGFVEKKEQKVLEIEVAS